MKELTEKDLNDAVINCKWRILAHGIAICSGNCAPCAHEIEKGTCATLLRLVAEARSGEADESNS